MTMLSTTRDRQAPSHFVPVATTVLLTAGAVVMIAYLLWPTWGVNGSRGPERLPVSIGGTLFNVPTAAMRMKIQRHSGPQERIDLNFSYPSLEPPDAPRHVSASEVDDEMAQPIDRIFLSIAAHHDAMAPEVRVRSIYPRYLEDTSNSSADGIASRAFRASTPYSGEDLYIAGTPAFAARCTRDASTPGMCLSERRIEGADFTFRFPKAWLAQWRDVANAMDRLTQDLHGGK